MRSAQTKTEFREIVDCFLDKLIGGKSYHLSVWGKERTNGLTIDIRIFLPSQRRASKDVCVDEDWVDSGQIRGETRKKRERAMLDELKRTMERNAANQKRSN